ncbi:MAG: hypothetical protein GF368_02095, partial [Candidatus Aenigmarchaeota archaeon]|nr:hypothetical protein [Candidatus Aenigmarchaeota archaeon]
MRPLTGVQGKPIVLYYSQDGTGLSLYGLEEGETHHDLDNGELLVVSGTSSRTLPLHKVSPLTRIGKAGVEVSGSIRCYRDTEGVGVVVERGLEDQWVVSEPVRIRELCERRKIPYIF